MPSVCRYVPIGAGDESEPDADVAEDFLAFDDDVSWDACNTL